MLREKCQVREATVHYTVCTGSAVEEPKHADLCPECSGAFGLEGVPMLPEDFQSVMRADCRYCGGEIYPGGLDSQALMGFVHEMRVMCKPCTEEYCHFLELKFPGLGNHPTKEQTALLGSSFQTGDFPAILVELEKHMKKWMAKGQ